MTKVRLSGALPAGREDNGLTAIAEQMAEYPETVHTLVVQVDTSKVTTDVDNETSVPTLRIRKVEPIERDDDLREALKLLRRASESRTGKAVLNYDLEGDLDDALGSGGHQ